MASIFLFVQMGGWLFRWSDGASSAWFLFLVSFFTLPLSLTFSYLLALLFGGLSIYHGFVLHTFSDDETASQDSQRTVSRMMMHTYSFNLPICLASPRVSAISIQSNTDLSPWDFSITFMPIYVQYCSTCPRNHNPVRKDNQVFGTPCAPSSSFHLPLDTHLYLALQGWPEPGSPSSHDPNTLPAWTKPPVLIRDQQG